MPKPNRVRNPIKPAPHSRVVGTARERMAAQVAQGYSGGMSIRELAAFHERSYGFIHRILSEAGVKLRGRGGAQSNRVAK